MIRRRILLMLVMSGYITMMKSLMNGINWEEKLMGSTMRSMNEAVVLGGLGTSVFISSDGKTLAIGAPYSHSNGYYGGVGKVYAYEEVSQEWVQVGGDIESYYVDEEFGGWVSISADGKIVAVGGSEYYYALGRVQVFENSCEI
mmetsp:Transcript_5407/g.5946  ORF Transcript_5407/g.5946 Transcript_5407/m.5946 type:complete len:144 (+) Transcript_5407:94-525(+)